MILVVVILLVLALLSVAGPMLEDIVDLIFPPPRRR